MAMDKDILLHQLENLAEKIGIEIRYEDIENDLPFSPGGLCRLGDRYVLIVNKAIPKEDMIRTVSLALVRFDLNRVYVRPGLREFLTGFQGSISHPEKQSEST